MDNISVFGTEDSRFKSWRGHMKKISILFLIIFLGSLLFPLVSSAALVPCGGPGQPACQFCHIFVLLNNIIHFILFTLTPIVAALMIVIGGFYLLIAGPNPELFSKGKAILTATVIGLVIVFVAWVFLNTFLDFLGVAEWTGLKTWWQIRCP